MTNRLILRTTSNLSFAGEICKNEKLEGENGILIKPSEKSEIKVWCPLEEVKCIILPNGQMIEGEELRNGYKL
ncbi:MAG TPA: hypothetical protein VIO64_01315 [Pseudobacteroides sp.]|uniref:hypothetical protein n=1 Tax=Pseudobacteroides sp. TaxID=1968840 RepID=UPI002F953A31